MNFAECLSVVNRYKEQVPVDVLAIAAEIGIPVVYENLEDNISGAIRAVGADEDYQIVVNSNHPRVRQRFTVAHELGHYIYHRDLLGRGTGDTRAYRAAGTPYPNGAITAVQERQANNFAANTLMPTPLIRRFKAMGVKQPGALAPLFGVSPKAMEIRLGAVA